MTDKYNVNAVKTILSAAAHRSFGEIIQKDDNQFVLMINNEDEIPVRDNISIKENIITAKGAGKIFTAEYEVATPT